MSVTTQHMLATCVVYTYVIYCEWSIMSPTCVVYYVTYMCSLYACHLHVWSIMSPTCVVYRYVIYCVWSIMSPTCVVYMYHLHVQSTCMSLLCVVYHVTYMCSLHVYHLHVWSIKSPTCVVYMYVIYTCGLPLIVNNIMMIMMPLVIRKLGADTN